MRRHVQIEILGLASILVLLSWISPQQIAHAKEAPGRPLDNQQNRLTDQPVKYLLAKRDRTSESSSETRAETTPENTSDSQSSSSASDGDATPSSAPKEEQHTLLYYAAQAIGILIGGTILLALISSSSVIFLATIWHTLKLMNGGKKPSIG